MDRLQGRFPRRARNYGAMDRLKLTSSFPWLARNNGAMDRRKVTSSFFTASAAVTVQWLVSSPQV